MVIKSNLVIIQVIILAILSCCSGCHKLFCVPNHYNFTGGIAKLYPDKDSIQIGDTLWFTCSAPLNLKYYDGASTDSINYNIGEATNIVTDIHLSSLTGTNTQVGAIDSFAFLPVKGELKTNSLISAFGKTISFVENQINYENSFGIVAQKRGIYLLTIADIYQGEKKCDKFSIAIIMNNADNHLHYLRDIYYGGGSVDLITSTHSYCFKVY